MVCGSMRIPSLGKTLYAPTCSISEMSAAPIATGRNAGILLVTPKRCAVAITVPIPTLSASFSAGMLRDSANAFSRVIVPL